MTDDQVTIGESKVQSEFPITFETLTGLTIPATGKDLVFKSSEQAASCDLIFEVSGDWAQTIKENAWFHLFDNVIMSHPPIDKERPARFHVRLRPKLAEHIAKSGGDAETVFQALLPSNADSTKQAHKLPLYLTECWMAYEVTQVMPLPEHLGSEGTLNAGFKTKWGNPGQNPFGSLLEQVAAYLKSQNLKYESIDDTLLKLHFHNENGQWVCLIRLEEEIRLCIIYSVFPWLIPTDIRADIALLLMSENYNTVSGNYEMDDEDGELRFRSTLTVSDTLDTAQLGLSLATHLEVMNEALPSIKDILDQTTTFGVE